MTTVELLAELREVIDDEIPAYGFSDARALGYLNEGQQKFCEDTGFFSDTITFTVDTDAGTSTYPLDSRIIRVEDVYSGSRRLKKLVGHRDQATALEPTCWKTDADSGRLTVWPTPTTIVTLALHAWRYPLADLKDTATVVNPEIPKRMHRACLEWAAYKCYGHHDIELQDAPAALKHKAAYRQYVLEGRVLKRNMDAEEIEVGTNSVYQTSSTSSQGFRV